MWISDFGMWISDFGMWILETIFLVLQKRYNGKTDFTDWADRNGFFVFKCAHFKQKKQKKSVSIRPIRPIRSPIVSPCSPKKIVSDFGMWISECFHNKLIINQLFRNPKSTFPNQCVSCCRCCCSNKSE
jgi:hypothetical protein